MFSIHTVFFSYWMPSSTTIVKISTIRLVLAIAAARDYNATSIDIKQAYLQAELSEDLDMAMPPGLPNTDDKGNKLIVKLRKSLYGLKQAGREWGQLLTSFMTSWGFKQSVIDVCPYQESWLESPEVFPLNPQ